jgi:Asp-tRNA(Asn)/Glu-tRNA(Gln) amidotransferase A subunit family amidase
MDVGAYCDTLEKQLIGWKAKLYDVIRVVDKLSEGDKETVFPSIRDLHTFVEEIDGEIEQLRTACPADWSPNRQTIDAKMTELQQTLKKLSAEIGGPLIPDSLSWVSK